MENKLVPVKESFFKKIYNFFKKVFRKKEEYNNNKSTNIIEQEKNNMKKDKNEFKDSLIVKQQKIELETETDTNATDEEGTDLFERLKSIGYDFEEESFVNDINVEEDKGRLLKLYNSVKNNKVDLKKLKAIDLIRIRYLIRKEVEE